MSNEKTMSVEERAKHLAYVVIEAICHIVDKNIYEDEIRDGIIPDIAAELEAYAADNYKAREEVWKSHIDLVIKKAMTEEREACAKVSESVSYEWEQCGKQIAETIRARGTK